MKKILAICASTVVLALSASAACGKKVTNTGELKSYDAESKSITVVEGDKEVKVTLTPTTVAKGKDGAEAKVEDLVGKTVKVVSEHNKADSVEES
jgi:hypothetical protein